MKRAIRLTAVWTGLCAIACAAGGALDKPLLGCIRDPAGLLRPVYGVAGVFLLGEAWASRVRAAACGHEAILIEANEEIVWMSQTGVVLSRTAAPSSGALFGYHPDGRPALVYFPDSGELLQWEADRLKMLALIHEPAVAIAMNEHGAVDMVLRRPDGLWQVSMSPGDGSIQREFRLGIDAGPVLIWPSGSLVYSPGEEVVIRSAQGVERRLPLPRPVTHLERMGRDWVHIWTDEPGLHYALFAPAGEARLYQLPAAGAWGEP